MTLFNVLVHLPHDELRRLACEFGVHSSSPSKRTLMNGITAKYKDESFIGMLADELPEASLNCLRLLVFGTDPRMETIDLSESFPGHRTPHSPQDQILPIVENGLAFLESSKHYSRILLPAEIRQALKTYFLAQFEPLVPLEEIETPFAPIHPPGIEAIFHLLALVLHHRPTQTQKGTIHHRVAEWWAQRTPEAPLWEDAFDFVMEFCRRHQLVLVEKGKYRLSNLVAPWLDRDLHVLQKSLWNYFFHHVVVSDPVFQTLFMLLHTVPPPSPERTTTSLFSVEEWMSRCLPSALPAAESNPSSDESPERRVDQAIQAFAFAGIVNVDRAAHPARFSISPFGNHVLFQSEFPGDDSNPMPCTLQPNFDLLVPPTVSYSDLWKIEHLAEFCRRDVLTQYHLSQKSILFGMRRGWSKDDVSAFLQRLTGGAIAGNVRYSLEEWSSRYGRIHIQKVVLIECVTPQLADELKHVPDLQPLKLRPISDRHFAVTEANAKDVLQKLRDAGYEPSSVKPME